MKVLLVLACLVAVGLAARNADWANFKASFGKKYPTLQEEKYRQKVFFQNLQKIKAHNQRFENGEVTFTLGVNQFADMENKEFTSKMNGFKTNPRKTQGKLFSLPKGTAVPDSMDWRTKGYVTGVKDQGQCGSCWSFSATGSLEGQHFARTGSLVSLSEQNLMDCSWGYGNEGCDGGWMDQAFAYVIANGGDDTEASYPYQGVDGVCQFNPANVGATASSFSDIAKGSENDLLNAAGTVGPISVAIDASHESFQLYSSGVYNEPGCSTTTLDHGVLVAGYGTDNGVNYWLVKNSWGTSWGMQGYIEMTRDGSNQCGIATSASYPIV